jgi:TRAP-type C4-dicarboxylate transport system permease small subunit
VGSQPKDDSMRHIIDWYFRALKLFVVICISSMVVLVFGNVVLRYGFNSGITVSEELSRWFFVWLTFSGAIIAMREHTHLGMDTVVSKLPVLGKKICYVLSHLIMLLCIGLFFQGSWEQTLINLDVEAPASGLSTGFFYGVGLFFCVPAFLILLYDLYLMLSGKLEEKELIGIKDSEEELEAGKLEALQHEMERESARLDSNSKNR